MSVWNKLAACLVDRHDPGILALAVAICASGFLIVHGIDWALRDEPGARTRRRWLALRALVLGSAIWATHFVAMIAYLPGLPVAYAVVPTLASLVVVIVGIRVALPWYDGRSGRQGHVWGGASVGLAVVVMHYVGMSGFHVPGRLVWDQAMLAGSGLVGTALLAAGAWFQGDARRNVRLASLLLPVAGVATIHLAGMTSFTLVPDRAAPLPALAFSATGLAIPIAVAIFGMLAAAVGMAGLVADRGRRIAREQQRLQAFANLALEGLLICRDGRIVTGNESAAQLLGTTLAELVGQDIAGCFDDPTVAGLAESGETAAGLLAAGGVVPVRVLARRMDIAGGPHLIVALRDQRERLRAEAELKQLAHHDALTGLPNRRSFADTLSERLTGSRTPPLTLMMVDLDRFKAVNDTLGHAMGDALLVRAAERLAVAIEPGDMLVRLGGDEFAIVLDTIAELPLCEVALRIVDTLSYPFLIGGHVLEIGASVGIARAPRDGATPEQLTRSADLAMYAAKDAGRGTWKLFDRAMDGRMQHRRSLELDLRRAVARREFEVHYQPLFSAADSRCLGAEALVRWPHAGRGMVPPDEFIPLAEDVGLIAEIGHWVLLQSCREAAGWPPDTHVAVNVSSIQLLDPRFVAVVAAALAETGLPAHRLELEVTETALIEDEDRTMAVLTGLRTLGVRLAMDDFGTGYSSLSYLHRFPFNRLKIDRSFITNCIEDPARASLVRAITAMGANLGLAVTAEGVENAEQRAFVESLGCDTLQGYLLGRPMPATELRRLFDSAPGGPGPLPATAP